MLYATPLTIKSVGRLDMALPLLIGIQVAGQGLRWLAPKIAKRLIQQGKGKATGKTVQKGTPDYNIAMKNRGSARTLRLADTAKARKLAESKKAAAKKRTATLAKTKERVKYSGPESRYAQREEMARQAWRKLTPAQKKQARKTRQTTDEKIIGSTRVTKKTTTPKAEKGMRFGRKGETTSRKRGGKIMYGYKAGGKV